MQIKKAIIGVAAGLLVSGSLGGVALAASGDEAPNPDTAVSQVADANEAPETEANEAAETEGAESDGPGGHEDPPGDVDHQFEGEE